MKSMMIVIMAGGKGNRFWPRSTEELHLSSFYLLRGVAHGYRVLGHLPASIVYFTNMAYNPAEPDEYRMAYNDPAIGFDWQTKFRSRFRGETDESSYSGRWERYAVLA